MHAQICLRNKGSNSCGRRVAFFPQQNPPGYICSASLSLKWSVSSAAQFISRKTAFRTSNTTEDPRLWQSRLDIRFSGAAFKTIDYLTAWHKCAVVSVWFPKMQSFPWLLRCIRHSQRRFKKAVFVSYPCRHAVCEKHCLIAVLLTR